MASRKRIFLAWSESMTKRCESTSVRNSTPGPRRRTRAEFLFEQATGQRGDGSAAVTAAIFWLKTRARWKETIATEHSGPDGKPIEIADQSAEIERKRIAARALLDETFGCDGNGGDAA